LFGNAAEGVAFRLGFDHPDRLAGDKQEVIGGVLLELKFPQSDAVRRAEVHLLIILNLPACRGEQFVNFEASLFFRRHSSIPFCVVCGARVGTVVAAGSEDRRRANGRRRIITTWVSE
jgi:hypothetical protein